MPQVQVKSDAQYAAESDARTLANASIIVSDSKRLAAAKKAAASMVADEIKDAKLIVARLDKLLEIAGQASSKVEGMKVIKRD